MTDNLKLIPTKDLIKELNNRGLLTQAKSNKIILESIDGDENINIILSKGLPTKKLECRECRGVLPSESFNYYSARVDKDGYLMRSNALCNTCSNESDKKRKKVLDSANIPNKPKKGDECPNCKRYWRGNWHRHHVGENFVSWLCGHCNMSFSDQRNNNY